VNALDDDGATPLMLALASQHPRVAQVCWQKAKRRMSGGGEGGAHPPIDLSSHCTQAYALLVQDKYGQPFRLARDTTPRDIHPSPSAVTRPNVLLQDKGVMTLAPLSSPAPRCHCRRTVSRN
jgi:hypothetical protein